MKNHQKFLLLIALLNLIGCDSTLFSHSNSAPCTNLHKVTNADDLVQQMYDNIDSSCLFDMPTADLEKIWEIKVFDLRTELGAKNAEARRQYDKEENGIYLARFDYENQDHFQLFTTEPFIKSHAESYGEAELSKGKLRNLPPFDIQRSIEISDHRPVITLEDSQKLPESPLGLVSDHVWLNKEKSMTKPYLVLSTMTRKIPSIFFYKNAIHSKYHRKRYFNSWF